MAFPTVEATNISSEATAVTSHTVSLPANVAAGDLLVVAFICDAAPTVTWPGDWETNRFIDRSIGPGFHVTLSISYLVAAGGETSITVETDASETSAHASYRISGQHDTQAPEGTFSEDSSADTLADPPSHTASWGAEDNLWIEVAAIDRGNDVTAASTGFTNLLATKSGTASDDVSVGSARKEDASATVDPDGMTIDVSGRDVSATIVIRPAAAAAGGFRSRIAGGLVIVPA